VVNTSSDFEQGRTDPDAEIERLIVRAQECVDTGQFAHAQRLWQGVLGRCERTLGSDHPTTIGVANNLAYAMSSQGEFQAARRIQEQLLPLCDAKLGVDHQGTLTLLRNLSHTLCALGDLDAAQNIQTRLCRTLDRVAGTSDSATVGVPAGIGVAQSHR
jgi:hypothetical protein